MLMPVAVPASEAAMRTYSLETKYNDRASTWTNVPHLVGWGAFGPGGMLVLGVRNRSLTHASLYETDHVCVLTPHETSSLLQGLGTLKNSCNHTAASAPIHITIGRQALSGAWPAI